MRGRVRPIVPEYEYNNENGFRRRSASPLLVLRLRSRDFFSHIRRLVAPLSLSFFIIFSLVFLALFLFLAREPAQIHVR